MREITSIGFTTKKILEKLHLTLYYEILENPHRVECYKRIKTKNKCLGVYDSYEIMCNDIDKRVKGGEFGVPRDSKEKKIDRSV